MLVSRRLSLLSIDGMAGTYRSHLRRLPPWDYRLPPAAAIQQLVATWKILRQLPETIDGHRLGRCTVVSVTSLVEPDRNHRAQSANDISPNDASQRPCVHTNPRSSPTPFLVLQKLVQVTNAKLLIRLSNEPRISIQIGKQVYQPMFDSHTGYIPIVAEMETRITLYGATHFSK